MFGIFKRKESLAEKMKRIRAERKIKEVKEYNKVDHFDRKERYAEFDWVNNR